MTETRKGTKEVGTKEETGADYPLEPGQAVTEGGKVVSVDDPEVAEEPPENPYVLEGHHRSQQNDYAYNEGVGNVSPDQLTIGHPDSDIHDKMPDPT
jgi:hypothetical protein